MGKNRNKHSKERRTYTYTRTQNFSREELQSQLSDSSKKLASGCAAFIVALIMGAILSLLGAWVFMYAWNLGIAVAFGLEPIGYWTAFWIVAAFEVVGSCWKKQDINLNLFDDSDDDDE